MNKLKQLIDAHKFFSIETRKYLEQKYDKCGHSRIKWKTKEYYFPERSSCKSWYYPLTIKQKFYYPIAYIKFIYYSMFK